MVRLAEL